MSTIVQRAAAAGQRPLSADRCRHRPYKGRRTPAAPGFTLVETMVSIMMMAFAASVILLAVETSVSDSSDSVEQTIAAGMAKQLMNEVLGKRYMAAGGDPYQYPLSPSSWESNGTGRERFDDSDDYHRFVAEGAEDLWGNPLGEGDDAGGWRHASFRVPSGYFDNWRQRVRVYYVDPDDPSVRLPAWSTSNFRAVEVLIYKRDADGTLRNLSTLRRVYAYIPPP